MSITEKIKKAEANTEENPTERQKISGNYKKGKVIIKGLKITIENPEGSIRSGVDKEGNSWSNEMSHTYGYFNGTIGKDGDPIDVYLGPMVEDSLYVYVIDQVEESTKAFDEHKVMFGFSSEAEAKKAYLSCFHDDWRGFGSISAFSLDKFKQWIKNADRIKYPASKLNITSRMNFKNVSKEDEGLFKIIQLSGEVIDGTTLLDLKEQAGDVTLFDTLVVEIASPGGSVSEGLEIMLWLEGLSQSEKQIITVVTANAYSIASLIMLVANTRLISKHGRVMVHNPMLPNLEYVNANDLEAHVVALRDLEAIMYELYQVFTGLNTEQIKALMDNETYLNPQQAVEYNFADAVVDIKPKPFEMATNIKKELNMTKALNVLSKVIAMVNKSDFVNQLYYSTTGTELEIYQKDPAVYAEGDRTNLESGEVVLSDGATITIEDFVITKIDKGTPAEEAPKEEIPAEDATAADANVGPAPTEVVAADPVEAPTEVPVAADPVVAPMVEPAQAIPGKVIEKTESTVTTKEVVATQISSINTWEFEVVNTTFEVGEKVEYKPSKPEDEPSKVTSGEYLLEDGARVLIDSDGIIQFKKPAPSQVAPMAKDESKDEDLVEMKSKYAALEEKNGTLEETMNKLKMQMDEKFEAASKFQDIAAQAIDSIASNLGSDFKPSARAGAQSSTASAKSIFSQLKEKRGLK